MSSLNKACILGRVGQNPETKQMQSGTSLTTLTLATHEVWRDKQGEKKEDLQWHNIVVWGKQAETVAKYVSKGDLIYVEGKIQTDTYEKDGVKHWSTKIIAKDVKFLTPKKGNSFGEQAQPTQFPRAQQEQPRQQAPQYDSYNDIPF
jgi:single-strand DNA-binding protein